MRKFSLLLFAFFACSLARAESHQVTSLSTSSVSTIIIPGGGPGTVLWVSITNVGANAVNITADGGTANSLNGTDPVTGAMGLCQFQVAAGQTLVLWGPYVRGVPVRAIMATGTTTLNIGTNAPVGTSSFPTN